MFATSTLQKIGIDFISCVRVPRNGLPKLVEHSCSCPGSSETILIPCSSQRSPKDRELTFRSEYARYEIYLWFLVNSLERVKTDFPSVFPCDGLPKLRDSLSVLSLPGIWGSLVFWEFCLAIDRFRYDTRFIALDFAFTVSESSERHSWDLFDITTLCFLFERFMMLNRRKTLFHSSCEKLPLVNMSVIWFLMSTYLIWILESKLIQSNDQSNATRCVLDTCLKVGLLPLIIIFDNCLVILKDVQTGFTIKKSVRSQEPELYWKNQHVGHHLLRFGNDLWSYSGHPWDGNIWVCITLCRTQHINYNVPQIKSGVNRPFAAQHLWEGFVSPRSNTPHSAGAQEFLCSAVPTTWRMMTRIEEM